MNQNMLEPKGVKEFPHFIRGKLRSIVSCQFYCDAKPGKQRFHVCKHTRQCGGIATSVLPQIVNNNLPLTGIQNLSAQTNLLHYAPKGKGKAVMIRGSQVGVVF